MTFTGIDPRVRSRTIGSRRLRCERAAICRDTGRGGSDYSGSIYYDEPEALLVHVNGILKATWAKFRDFQSWVRVEYGSNGFVEVEYDVDEFEEAQRLQEERRLWRAHVWEKIFADDPPEEGEFVEYVNVYDQETRAFVMRPKELEEGTRTIAVFDKLKMKLAPRKTYFENGLFYGTNVIGVVIQHDDANGIDAIPLASHGVTDVKEDDVNRAFLVWPSGLFGRLNRLSYAMLEITGCVGAPRVHVYARPPETERGETHDAEVLRRGLDEAVKGFDRRTKLRTPLDLRHQ
uniref:Uncharacterized protein n=1 Tax=Oryza glumipatula TaxID=40148 RepID=A0A0E0BL61_9ORYZ